MPCSSLLDLSSADVSFNRDELEVRLMMDLFKHVTGEQHTSAPPVECAGNRVRDHLSKPTD